MDLLNLNATVETLDTKTLPEASQLANGIISNAAALLNGTVNNAAVLAANLIQGIEGERMEAVNGFSVAIAPLIAESQAWRAQVSRLCDILERFSLKP